MELELKLHSPVGGDSITYSWPVSGSVSIFYTIWDCLRFCLTSSRTYSVCACVLETSNHISVLLSFSVF